jgi:hypothetical protein
MRRFALLAALPLLLVATPAYAEGSDTQLIVGQDHPTEGLRLAVLPISGGDGTNLAKDGLVHVDVAVSPNGQWVVYTSVAEEGTTRELVMRRTDGSTAPVPVEHVDEDVYSPAWAPDGRSVSYSVDTDTGPVICRTVVTTAGGGECTVVTDEGYDDASWFDQTTLIADQGAIADDGALVALALDGEAVTLDGTEGGLMPSVSPDGTKVAYLAPSDDQLSETIKVADLSESSLRTLPTPSGHVFGRPSWTRDQVALYVDGATASSSNLYRIDTVPGGEVTTVPTSGDILSVATVKVDVTPPTNVKLGGIPAISLAGYVTPTFSADDAASYLLSIRRAGPNTGYVSAGTVSLIDPKRIPLQAGYSYCFSVRALDDVGNASAPTAEQCVMAPLDDRAMVHSSRGWTLAGGSGFYASTASLTTTYNTTLSRGITTVKQLAVVARTCPTCGIVDVYVGGSQVGRINTASATTKDRQVFTLPAFAPRSAVVMLRVPTRGKAVVIDALGFLK